MGRDVSIKLTFDSPVAVDTVLDRLGEAGWSAVSDGQIMYMVGDYDWDWADQREGKRVRAEMAECAAGGRTTGIALWRPESHGVNVLIMPGMDTMIVELGLNRRPLPGAPDLTDLAWYLERLLPPVVQLGLRGVVAQDEYEG